MQSETVPMATVIVRGERVADAVVAADAHKRDVLRISPLLMPRGCCIAGKPGGICGLNMIFDTGVARDERACVVEIAVADDADGTEFHRNSSVKAG